jgi:hypothetical protein
MTKLYVTYLDNYENKCPYGLESDMDRINKDLSIIFNLPKDIEDLKNSAKQNKEGTSYIHRFCQFIIYIYLASDLKKGGIAFFDCENNMDTALEVYNKFGKDQFPQMIRQDFINQFIELQEIYQQVSGWAELTVEELPE